MPVPSYSLIVSLAQETFEPSGSRIIPMAALAVRLGGVKKCEKDFRRATPLQEASALGVSTGAPACTPFQRHSCRRKREAKQNAEARRLKEDMAVSGTVKDLLKAIRESTTKAGGHL